MSSMSSITWAAGGFNTAIAKHFLFTTDQSGVVAITFQSVSPDPQDYQAILAGLEVPPHTSPALPFCVTAQGSEATTVCSIGHYGCLGAAMGLCDSASLDLCLLYAVPLGVIQTSGQPQLLPLYATGASLGRCLLCRCTQRCPQLQVLSRCLPLDQQLPRLRALQPALSQALRQQSLALSLPRSPASQQPQQQTTAPQRWLRLRPPLHRPMTRTTWTQARWLPHSCPRLRLPQTSRRTLPWTWMFWRLGRQLAPQLPLRQRLRLTTMTQPA